MMLQFTSQEMTKIRMNASQDILNNIISNNKVILNSEILVPPDGRATWNLYYFCPKHGVRLKWDRNKPTEHECPIDGEIFTGEPYDGAWWRWLNGLNAKACNDLGLLWQITQEQHYLDKVKDILLTYAKYYPDYEEHGGIPYNGPGKANAQTLCEANCHIDFVRGYDFIRDELSADEQTYIEERLLREGAEFLMQHRGDQLHNHEMKISATIGVIGLILNDETCIDFAVNAPYGLRYQLNHGVKGEGLWFEGSIHYHYYALQALLDFEKAARRTPYSLKSEANFHTMFAFPLKLLMSNGDFPRLNDCIAGQEKLNHTHLFEFAYSAFKTPLFASALQTIYQHSSRNNIDALLYGVETLDQAPLLQCQSMHAQQSGITIMHEAAKNHMMLIKHSPFGGEHDHYDRLNFILIKNGKEILPDLGTTGYGAELHYSYYKNTLTHNTLAVECKNQPPANSKVNKYLKTDEYTWLDVETNWGEKPPKVDSHTIVQWCKESYQNIRFRRQILWLGDVAIEFNNVNNPYEKQLDLVWHVRGIHKGLNQRSICKNPMKGALERMANCHCEPINGHISLLYGIEEQPDFVQQIFTTNDVHILRGYAPDNPATSDLAYSIAHAQDKMLKLAMIHHLEGGDAAKIKDFTWKENHIEFKLIRYNKKLTIIIQPDKGKLEILK